MCQFKMYENVLINNVFRPPKNPKENKNKIIQYTSPPSFVI